MMPRFAMFPSDTIDARLQKLPGADCTILRQLESYWQSLRHAQTIPARNAIAPQAIDPILPYAFVLQRVAPRVARIRVAGRQIHDLLRMDARGMPLSVLFTADSRDRMADLIETAFTAPAILAVHLQTNAQVFRPALPATMLFLPLRDEQGVTSRLIGACVVEGATGPRPRRFDIVPGSQLRLDRLGLTLASSVGEPAKRPDTKRPALRLVVNNG
jgi:hypothetical protein